MYLIVGVGWISSFNLLTNKKRCVSIKVQSTTGIPSISEHRLCVLLPALTLTVLDERQLHELMFQEGGPHQLHTDQKHIQT